MRLLRVMPVRMTLLRGETLLWEAHAPIKAIAVVAHRAAFGKELNRLRWQILFAGAGYLFMRRVNLVFALVFLGVFNIRLAHVVRERCLVAHVAGGHRRRGHQYRACHLAVLGHVPILLGQEFLVFEPRIGRNHVRRAVVVLAHLHQPRVQYVLVLVIKALAAQRSMAVVRFVRRSGLTLRAEMALRPFVALVFGQFVVRASGGPVFGVRDRALHFLIKRRIPLDVRYHVRILGRCLLALVVDKVLAAGRCCRDSPADALLISVDVLRHRRALFGLGADIGVRDVIPVGRVVHLVGFAVRVCGNGWLSFSGPLVVQMLYHVA